MSFEQSIWPGQSEATSFSSWSSLNWIWHTMRVASFLHWIMERKPQLWAYNKVVNQASRLLLTAVQTFLSLSTPSSPVHRENEMNSGRCRQWGTKLDVSFKLRERSKKYRKPCLSTLVLSLIWLRYSIRVFPVQFSTDIVNAKRSN